MRRVCEQEQVRTRVLRKVPYGIKLGNSAPEVMVVQAIFGIFSVLQDDPYSFEEILVFS